MEIDAQSVGGALDFLDRRADRDILQRRQDCIRRFLLGWDFRIGVIGEIYQILLHLAVIGRASEERTIVRSFWLFSQRFSLLFSRRQRREHNFSFVGFFFLRL